MATTSTVTLPGLTTGKKITAAERFADPLAKDYQPLSIQERASGYRNSGDPKSYAWNGETYKPGQVVDTSSWSPQEIKGFRDMSLGSFDSNDFLTAFDQYSLDNLDGRDIYDFQLNNGTRDEWADMTTSPEMNKFYTGFGVNPDDRQSAYDYYDYYDGTQTDAEGNVTKEGSGVNDLAKVNPTGNYTDLENIVGQTGAEGTDRFMRGYWADTELDEQRIRHFDGQASNELDEEDYAGITAQAFQGFNKSAKDQGKATTEGGLRGSQEETPAEDTLPTIDPDITPRDMWSEEDVARILRSTEINPDVTIDGKTMPRLDVTTEASDRRQPFEYTEGSLDDPLTVNEESLFSAVSLLGDDIGYIPNVETDSGGNTVLAEESQETSDRQQYDDTTFLEEGRRLHGLGNSYARTGEGPEQLREDVLSGKSPLSGPLFDGWTSTQQLAKDNDWTGEEIRRYLDYVSDNRDFAFTNLESYARAANKQLADVLPDNMQSRVLSSVEDWNDSASRRAEGRMTQEESQAYAKELADKYGKRGLE